MNLKRIFNYVLMLFLFVVPLFPFKVKLAFLPMSADFLIGGALILAGFFTVIQMHLNGEKPFRMLRDGRIKLLAILISVFGVLSVASVIYAGNRAAVISESIRFIEYVSMFFLIIAISDEATIENGLKIFYFAMILASVIGVFQFIINYNRYPTGGLLHRCRIYATFDNPNYWGAAVNMVIFYPLINIIERRKVRLNILIFLVLLFNLIFASTRGSWLGFAVGVFALGLIRYKKQVIYALGLFPLMFLLPITRNRFLEFVNIQERFKLWKTGVMMFLEHPLLGVGNGNYIFRYERFVKREHRELYLGRSIFSVHNSYIKMFAELGIFGGLSFTLMYLVLFKLIYDVYKFSVKYKSFALVFVGFGASYLFQNFFNNLIFIPQLNVFTWVIIAMLYKGVYLEGKIPGVVK